MPPAADGTRWPSKSSDGGLALHTRESQLTDQFNPGRYRAIDTQSPTCHHAVQHGRRKTDRYLWTTMLSTILFFGVWWVNYPCFSPATTPRKEGPTPHLDSTADLTIVVEHR